MSAWGFLQDTGRAQDLHHRSARRLAAWEGRKGRLAVLHRPCRPALVLGSTQPSALVDGAACAAAGVEVARRRSGGGAVLVEPGSLIWVDLLVPAGDALWRADVGQAAWWVGEAWARALENSGLPGAEVWRGGLVKRPWSSVVCFAGLGPGEVTISGRKVVGISQRRGRQGALFQSACLVEWCPARLVGLLDLPAAEREQCLGSVAPLAVGAGPAGPEALLEAFLAGLG